MADLLYLAVVFFVKLWYSECWAYGGVPDSMIGR
jgi:hypothetical protein